MNLLLPRSVVKKHLNATSIRVLQVHKKNIAYRSEEERAQLKETLVMPMLCCSSLTIPFPLLPFLQCLSSLTTFSNFSSSASFDVYETPISDVIK